MKGKFVHVADDGTQIEVTEGVQALYDLVISSMDWGSGFLSYEDAVPVGEIAELGAFEQADEVQRYVMALRGDFGEEYKIYPRRAANPSPLGRVPKHNHVRREDGKCVWPRCEA